MNPFLSVCMIVKNEELNLGRALESFADLSAQGAEIVVVDTGSTDRTVAIATAAGAKVAHFAWIDDFAAARNFAFAQASGEWLVVVDADEILTPEFAASVRRVLAETKATALSIPTTSVDDRGIPGATVMSVRLIKNGMGYAYEGRVHEVLTTSITRLGGRTDAAMELTLVHHGYTTAESARKDRHARNLKLLEAAHAADPNEPRYWHYLGAEYKTAGDHEKASTLFDRVLTRAPDFELVGWTASMLFAIHEAEQAPGLAFEVGAGSLDKGAGRAFCLAKMGRLAIREGDGATALWCANELERSLPDVLATRAACFEYAAEIRAAAHLLQGRGTTKACDAIRGLLAKYPTSLYLGDLLVKAWEAALGTGKGLFEAIRRADNARVVVSAAMKALLERGSYRLCVELGEKTGVRNAMYAFALARVGRLEDAKRELLAFGDSAGVFGILFGLAHGDAEVVEQSAAVLTPAHRQAMTKIRAGQKVPAGLAWLVLELVTRAIELREDAVAERLAASIPWTAGELVAYRALATLEAGDSMKALNLALQHPQELGSMEVIGLVAQEHGDLAAAAGMLSLRAKAGDAPARVYLRGAEVLVRLGQRKEAEAMLALGRESRPHSRAFEAETKGKANKKKLGRAA